MPNFFVDDYDLYLLIVKDSVAIASKLARAILIATKEDLADNLKDSCLQVQEAGSYEEAAEPLEFLWNLLTEKLGVYGQKG